MDAHRRALSSLLALHKTMLHNIVAVPHVHAQSDSCKLRCLRQARFPVLLSGVGLRVAK